MPTKISVLGPVPPPFGGVSIHVIRFAEIARSHRWDVVVCPYTGSRSSSRFKTLLGSLRMILGSLWVLIRHRSDITHIHYGGLAYFLAVAPLLLLISKRRIITFHSVRVLQDTEAAASIVRNIALSLLNRFDLFVCVRKKIGDALRNSNLDHPDIFVMPAFLPPTLQETDRDRIPGDLAKTIMESERENRLRLCCAAYYLGPGYGHEDIYGAEMLAQALKLIDAELMCEMDLLIMVSNPPVDDVQVSAEKEIRETSAGLKKTRIHLHYGAPLIPVLAMSHAFLRPSKEDGDSVAIREAMALGLPVLASNVVSRPDAVHCADLATPEKLAIELKGFLEDIPTTNPAPPPLIHGDEAEVKAITTFLNKLEN